MAKQLRKQGKCENCHHTKRQSFRKAQRRDTDKEWGREERTGDLGEKRREEELPSLQVTMAMAGQDAQKRAGTAVKLEQ